jgi:hypothetical protein
MWTDNGARSTVKGLGGSTRERRNGRRQSLPSQGRMCATQWVKFPTLVSHRPTSTENGARYESLACT